MKHFPFDAATSALDVAFPVIGVLVKLSGCVTELLILPFGKNTNSKQISNSVRHCAVAQTMHIYKKPIQTPNKRCPIEGGKHLRGH